MEKLGLGLDDSGSTSDDRQQQSAEDARRLSVQRCIQSLVHACQCRDANCRLQSCQKMKRIVQHSKSCKRKNNGCSACRQLIGLCCHHAKRCQEARCLVPFCVNIRQKLQQTQLQQRVLQAQLMRRRMMAMQMSNSSQVGGQQGTAILPGGMGSPMGHAPTTSYTGGTSATEAVGKPIGTPPEASMRRPAIQSPSMAGTGAASSSSSSSSSTSSSSSQGGLLDGNRGHVQVMSPQQQHMIASPRHPLMQMEQQQDWKIPYPSPGQITSEPPKLNLAAQPGLAFGQQPQPASTAVFSSGQAAGAITPATANRTPNPTLEKLRHLLKSSLNSGNHQQLLALISSNPALAELMRQVGKKSNI